MRSRALRARPDHPAVPPWPPRLSVAGLVYLRGQDADGRLRELACERARARPVLGELALALLEKKGPRELGFRSLGDWARERLGLDARTVREWALVWKRLGELPLLRRAVLAGEIGWTVAGEAARLATPESEAACLETVRGRTVRAVKELVAAVRRAELRATGKEVAGGSAEEAEEEDAERVRVRIPCSPELARKWAVACELARRVAGEELSAWACAEAIAAECASAIGFPSGDPEPGIWRERRKTGWRESREHGLRHWVWPRLRWAASREKPSRLQRLVEGAAEATPRELDRRLRAATGFLQSVDLEIGRVLRQVRDRRLYRELGFPSFERFVIERLDLAGSTARRLVRMARAEHSHPAVATAFREGRITLLQAETLLRGGSLEFAQKVTLRRLEEEVLPGEVDFWAPPEVARLFQAMVEAMGGLEALLDHALVTWLGMQQKSHHYRIYKRDGWRCAMPGCTARRGLHAHHVQFRSRRGGGRAWNLLTLCVAHHQYLVHAGLVRITGRAPARIVFETGVGRFASGDVKLADEDRS